MMLPGFTIVDSGREVHGVVLGEDSRDPLRVAVDCVKEPGEGQTEDGSQEKHPDHYLLLDWSHERHVGPEHVHQTQTEEKQAACRQSEINIYHYFREKNIEQADK